MYFESMYINDVGPYSSLLLHSGHYNVITIEAERTGCIGLTHWGPDKMAAIFQTTFSNGFSWMKIFEFQLRIILSLFQKV